MANFYENFIWLLLLPVGNFLFLFLYGKLVQMATLLASGASILALSTILETAYATGCKLFGMLLILAVIWLTFECLLLATFNLFFYERLANRAVFYYDRPPYNRLAISWIVRTSASNDARRRQTARHQIVDVLGCSYMLMLCFILR